MSEVPSQEEINNRYNMQGATFRQKMALKGVKWIREFIYFGILGLLCAGVGAITMYYYLVGGLPW